ncbi:MAG TPA: DUF3015 family protein [Nitrospira sp.]|nr:DUF3015 family protein [Nitrospira sp.]
MTLSKNTMAVLIAIVIGHWHAAAALALSNPDTGPGCGLGKKLWDGWKGQKQIVPQVFIASTNVTGSYTFAISSGTSGCSNDGTIWDSQKAALFIEMNYASLEEDMARGGGEHLASLAELIDVPAEDRGTFATATQATYRSLVESGHQGTELVHRALSDARLGVPVQSMTPTSASSVGN